MRRMVFGVLVVMLVAGTVSAAQRKAETAATISLSIPGGMVTAAASGIWPALGDTVSFTVTFPKSVEKYGPRIQLLCYQNGSIVYGEAYPYTQSFVLGGSGSSWKYYTPTQPAHCVADLYYWSYQGRQEFHLLASTEFDAPGN